MFTPTLPDNIIKLNNNPVIRIFIVIGGISFILIVTHRLDYLGTGLLFLFALIICTIFVFLFVIDQLFLSYHRIKHMIKLFNS